MRSSVGESVIEREKSLQLECNLHATSDEGDLQPYSQEGAGEVFGNELRLSGSEQWRGLKPAPTTRAEM